MTDIGRQAVEGPSNEEEGIGECSLCFQPTRLTMPTSADLIERSSCCASSVLLPTASLHSAVTLHGCHHILCRPCFHALDYTSQITNLLENSTWTSVACPVCQWFQACTESQCQKVGTCPSTQEIRQRRTRVLAARMNAVVSIRTEWNREGPHESSQQTSKQNVYQRLAKESLLQSDGGEHPLSEKPCTLPLSETCRPEDVILLLETLVMEVEVLLTLQHPAAAMTLLDAISLQMSTDTAILEKSSVSTVMRLQTVLLKAETMKALEEWSNAIDTYKNLVDQLDEEKGEDRTNPGISDLLTFSLYHRIYTGYALCLYHTGDVSRALSIALSVLSQDRQARGAYTIVAQCQKAQGNWEEARKAMTKALLYETPWDRKNRMHIEQVYNKVMCQSGDELDTSFGSNIEGLGNTEGDHPNDCDQQVLLTKDDTHVFDNGVRGVSDQITVATLVTEGSCSTMDGEDAKVALYHA